MIQRGDRAKDGVAAILKNLQKREILVSRLCVPHMGFFTFNHGKWKLNFDVFCYVDPWHARTSGPDMRNFSELFGTEMGRRAQPITERQVRVK